MYTYFLGLNYVLALSLEILFVIRRPLQNSYNPRAVLYHCLSHFTAVALAGFMGLAGAAGNSEMSTCFIRQHTWGIYFMILPVFVYYPLALVVSIYAAVSFRNSSSVKQKVYLLRYTLVMVVYALGWLPVSVVYFDDIIGVSSRTTSHPIGMGFSSAAGLIANLIRFSDPAVMGRTKRYLRKRYSSRTNGASSLIQTEVVDFFQGLLQEVKLTQGALCAILSLHYYLSHQPQVSMEDSVAVKLEFTAKQLAKESEDIKKLCKPCKRHTVKDYQFSITERQPLIFASLRQLSSCNLLSSLDPVSNQRILKKNIGNRGGRSNAFIYVSFDRQIVLKSLTKSERILLTEQLLPDYSHRMHENNSVLGRIVGVFTLRTSKGLKQHIAVMENVLSGGEITAIFDMKGSRLARKKLKHSQEVTVEMLPSYEVYKDLDFFQTQKRLFVEEMEREKIRKGVMQDVEMLKKHGIMDYSLLIAVGRQGRGGSRYLYQASGLELGKVYFMGVIDYLQLYNRQKQLEGLGKSLLSGRREEVSSVDPETYARRFVKLVEQVLGLRDSVRTSIPSET